MFEKWKKWLGETIHDQIWQLLADEKIFLKVYNMRQENSKLDRPNAFWDFFRGVFVESVVMGIRRQLKAGEKSISLMRLLQEISQNPEVLSREAIAQLYPQKQWILDCFDADFSNGVRNCAEADMREIKNIAHKVEVIADKRIAHFDKGNKVEKIWKQDLSSDISDSICLLKELFNKYYRIFHGKELKSFFGYPTNGGWEEMFKVSWLPPDR